MTARSTVLLASALLASGLAAGCSDDAASAAPAALARPEAERVLARYAAAADHAGRSLDAAGLPAVETAPLLAMDGASIKLRKAVGRKTTPLKFTDTAFLIPRAAGYPRWFAVDAMSGSGKDLLRHALLFTQARAGAPWLATADPYPADDPLAAVALDADGLATAVPAGNTGLPLAPGKLAAAHAALLSKGPKAPAAQGLAAGPKTTEAYRALRAGQAALAAKGITLASTFAPAPVPAYALRTRGGGAVVWYTIRQNEEYSSAHAGRLSVSGDLVGLVPPRRVRTRMTSTVLVSYLATVPRKGAAPVSGMYRKAVSAGGS
ncbi:hypothetical protein [Actinomadura parmotrematis]|uniref:DUF8094 domain-containing protein n=1 Tax=Actinomadura parmotrematis TaxID=2864039 RepID=A0ABS7G4B2_9ACTN|nr:hypothetical protein [Actinomadura parmotrematis]MBW8487547.1 hypothetical protein [Actinomadura parmotrematis]